MGFIKVAWKAFTGFINPWGSVFDNLAELALGEMNKAIASIEPGNKAKMQAALNVARKVLNVMSLLSSLCPVKWQTAYSLTLSAVSKTVSSLEDLNVTKEELETIAKDFSDAVRAWRSPDDETCVDCGDCDGCCEKGID